MLDYVQTQKILFALYIIIPSHNFVHGSNTFFKISTLLQIILKLVSRLMRVLKWVTFDKN
jgi:hypothetical protein